MKDDTHTHHELEPGESVHYKAADVEVKSGSMWYETKTYKSLAAFVALFRWVVVGAVFLFGVYLYQRDINAQQAISVVDLQRDLNETKKAVSDYKSDTDKQLQSIRKDMLTRELYEAYRAADVERMARIEKLVEAVSNRP